MRAIIAQYGPGTRPSPRKPFPGAAFTTPMEALTVR